MQTLSPKGNNVVDDNAEADEVVDCTEADEAVEDQQDIPDMEVAQAPDAAADNQDLLLPMVVRCSNRVAKLSAAEVHHVAYLEDEQVARKVKSDWARDNKRSSGNMVSADFDHAVLLT